MITMHDYNGLRTFLSVLTRFTIVLCLFFPIATVAQPTTVILVPSSKSAIYTQTIKNIRDAIGSLANNKLELKILTPEEISLKGGLQFKNSKLIVPIGQHALKRVIKYADSCPVLATLISRFSFQEILTNDGDTNHSSKIGAIFIDQPVIREINFTRILLPGNKKLGFLVSRKNMEYLDKLKKLPKNNNHYIKLIGPHDNIISLLMQTLENSDVIVSLPDPLIFNKRTTRSILLSTYRKRKPLIGFSSAYVRAGALAAVYSTPAQIGKQTGELIMQLIQRNTINHLQTYDAKYFSIDINYNVARSLGISLASPEDIKSKLLKLESERD